MLSVVPTKSPEEGHRLTLDDLLQQRGEKAFVTLTQGCSKNSLAKLNCELDKIIENSPALDNVKKLCDVITELEAKKAIAKESDGKKLADLFHKQNPYAIIKYGIEQGRLTLSEIGSLLLFYSVASNTKSFNKISFPKLANDEVGSAIGRLSVSTGNVKNYNIPFKFSGFDAINDQNAFAGIPTLGEARNSYISSCYLFNARPVAVLPSHERVGDMDYINHDLSHLEGINEKSDPNFAKLLAEFHADLIPYRTKFTVPYSSLLVRLCDSDLISVNLGFSAIHYRYRIPARDKKNANLLLVYHLERYLSCEKIFKDKDLVDYDTACFDRNKTTWITTDHSRSSSGLLSLKDLFKDRVYLAFKANKNESEKGIDLSTLHFHESE